MANSGPNRETVEAAPTTVVKPNGIQIITVNDAVAQRLFKRQVQTSFAEVFQDRAPLEYVVGPGDTVEVSVWEAPPATLFGSSPIDVHGAPSAARAITFPEQMVNQEGFITVPFIGEVPAAGLGLRQIEREIKRGLNGKANLPQVLVRVTRNATANVTVVGEVTHSARFPLTAQGERLLDALAASGGVRQPVDKISLQVTRGDTVKTMALDSIIRDPAQNIFLQPGDVITALHQPFSFTALGATGKNEEVSFEAKGITLTQALARVGGVQDVRADAKGAFLFRWEDAQALRWPKPPIRTPDGRVPVIYQINLMDPATFFLSQSFPIRDKDILYVSNAPSAEFQKFLTLVMQIAYPVMTGINLAR